MGVFAAGVALLVGPEIWRGYKRRARAEGDALFFLRVYTDPHEWRPNHFVLLGALVASVLLPTLMPDNWWQLVAWSPFLVLSNYLRILPIHRGRQPPSTHGSAPQP